MDNKERNKLVKSVLVKHFKKVSVTGGRGTAYGWCHIDIIIDDPCPFLQHEQPCSSYDQCLDGICRGNNMPLSGGWGGSVRQKVSREADNKVDQLIKEIPFTTYTDDMNHNHTEVLTQISFK